MSNIQFEDPYADLGQLNQRRFESTGFAGFLIKKGFAKDEKAANLILVSFAILCFIIIFFALASLFKDTKSAKLDLEAIQQMRHLPKIKWEIEDLLS